MALPIILKLRPFLWLISNDSWVGLSEITWPIPFGVSTANVLRTHIVSFACFISLPQCLLFAPTELGNDKSVINIKRLRNR